MYYKHKKSYLFVCLEYEVVCYQSLLYFLGYSLLLLTKRQPSQSYISSTTVLMMNSATVSDKTAYNTTCLNDSFLAIFQHQSGRLLATLLLLLCILLRWMTMLMAVY